MGLKAKLRETVPVWENDFKSLLRNKERVMAIVMDSMLDDLLEKLLIQNFPKYDKKVVGALFNIHGPLSSLISKARLAYALNLIDREIFDDLNIIRDIRNRCAHDLFVTFTNTKICMYIGKLSIIPDGMTVTETKSYKFFMEAIRNSCLKISKATESKPEKIQ